MEAAAKAARAHLANMELIAQHKARTGQAWWLKPASSQSAAAAVADAAPGSRMRALAAADKAAALKATAEFWQILESPPAAAAAAAASGPLTVGGTEWQERFSRWGPDKGKGGTQESATISSSVLPSWISPGAPGLSEPGLVELLQRGMPFGGWVRAPVGLESPPAAAAAAASGPLDAVIGDPALQAARVALQAEQAASDLEAATVPAATQAGRGLQQTATEQAASDLTVADFEMQTATEPAELCMRCRAPGARGFLVKVCDECKAWWFSADVPIPMVGRMRNVDELMQALQTKNVDELTRS